MVESAPERRSWYLGFSMYGQTVRPQRGKSAGEHTRLEACFKVVMLAGSHERARIALPENLTSIDSLPFRIN